MTEENPETLKNPVNKETTAAETTAETTTIEMTAGTTETDPVLEGIPEEELWRLIEENIYCNQIFNMGMLPTVEKEIIYDENNNLYQVDTEVFPDYASFEEYIRSVYCREKADELLYNFPYEGVRKYVNQDGKLYVDVRYDAAKGYYVDWSEYTVTMNFAGSEECEFTLHARGVMYPGENPVLEEYSVEGSVVLEDGKWLLTKILY